MLVKISPTEPKRLRGIGETSSMPETFGCDVLLIGKAGLCGVQRKELGDLVSSLRDGRVAKEIGQQEPLSLKIWVLEGRPQWTRDGESLAVRGWSRTQQIGFSFSLLSLGCWVLATDSLDDTIKLILQLEKWLEKEKHQSLLSRPSPTGSGWGVRTNRHWGIHLLQSFPGIGSEVAGKIFDKYGRVPMKWEVTEDELMDIEGIGPGRARALVEGLEGS